MSGHDDATARSERRRSLADDSAPRPFADRVVIVTGGAGGIGLATARAFAKRGAQVVIADRSASAANAAAEMLATQRATGAACDVADEHSVARCVAQTLERTGRLDVVVNNAGVMGFKPLVELTAADWNRTLGVDLLGAFFFIRECFRHMRRGGAIVNVSSIHALETQSLVAPYAAAKAALVSLTRSAAIEGKPLGIRVNAVLPGAIDTAMLHDNPNVRAGREHLASGDVGEPIDIAEVIVFLASDAARFVHGARLVVDGGRLDRL